MSGHGGLPDAPSRGASGSYDVIFPAASDGTLQVCANPDPGTYLVSDLIQPRRE